jgi:hypothetical protein
MFAQNSETLLDEIGPANGIQDAYDFVKIYLLEASETNAAVDVLALVRHVDKPSSIVSRKSRKNLLMIQVGGLSYAVGQCGTAGKE